MFIALQVSISLIEALRPAVRGLRTRDRNLADQIARAATSISLNLAEGAKRGGLDQKHHYRIADGSCAEVKASIAVATAWGHLDGVDLTATRALLDRQSALLHRLINPRS